jgi:hypothetical protein
LSARAYNGTVFCTPEELGFTPATEEEIEAAKASMKKFREQILKAQTEGTQVEMPPKFWKTRD